MNVYERSPGRYVDVAGWVATSKAHWGHQFDHGPVQRVTEPPYQFPETQARPVALLGGDPMPGYDLVWKKDAPKHKCSLPWCNAQTPATYCSDRCADFGHRLYKLSERRDEFIVRMEVLRERRQEHLDETRSEICRGKRKGGRKKKGFVTSGPIKPRGIPAEIEWAKEQTSREIAALEQSWHAVQHEPAVGDERFFPLLPDDGSEP
jgi:hypothetical protein